MLTTRQRLAYWLTTAIYLLAAALVAWLIMLASGCAMFSSQQVETAQDGTKRETRIKVYTLFDAQSDLTKLRATTTDKTQGMTLAGLSESSSSTNAVYMLHLLAQILAAAK